MTDANVILDISRTKLPYMNLIAISEELYPGVSVSVKTDFKNGRWSVDSFILSSSSISESRENGRRLSILLESLSDSFGERKILGFTIKMNDSYQVTELFSDTEVDVIGIRVRLFGVNPALQLIGSEQSV